MSARQLISEVYNEDNMAGMARFPDGFFELAVVDPPYGIGAGKKASYRPNALTKYKPGAWDKCPPPPEYFAELFRVSKNQIIWGGNYFPLPPQPKWIVWDKMQPEGIDQAMFELAWTSVEKVQSMIYRQSAQSNSNNVSNNKQKAKVHIRIHPTQKPIRLYKWILQNYAKPGDKILDTHLGSGSSRIAAWDMGFDFYGWELDPDYYADQENRFAAHRAKPQLFTPEQQYQFRQGEIF
jgi:site-specific DNA-methyltransferase (adenine-specific)